MRSIGQNNIGNVHYVLFTFPLPAPKFLHVINKSSLYQQNNLKLELILKV